MTRLSALSVKRPRQVSEPGPRRSKPIFRPSKVSPSGVSKTSPLGAEARSPISARARQAVSAPRKAGRSPASSSKSLAVESAAKPGGTAPLAQVPGYRVAGKTGTAHKLEGGAYVERYVATFVGFAPVSNPRLVVAVMIDEPSNHQYYGGLVAAPVFSKVVGGALHALNVPNDAPPDNVIESPPDIVKEEV